MGCGRSRHVAHPVAITDITKRSGTRRRRTAYWPAPLQKGRSCAGMLLFRFFLPGFFKFDPGGCDAIELRSDWNRWVAWALSDGQKGQLNPFRLDLDLSLGEVRTCQQSLQAVAVEGIGYDG